MQDLPNRFVFMKVGNHAGEDWDAILERKRREISDTGMSFWGYGGTVCHPISQVQPFSRLTIKDDGRIGLIMVPVTSNAGNEELVATEYSEDAINWRKVPKGIRVTGSKYALVLGSIEPVHLEVDLGEFQVGVGPNRGKPAENYIKGRVDKACLERRENPAPIPGGVVLPVKFTAKLLEPYAVLLRPTRTDLGA